ncbi:hypothetical protein [Dyadobacter sp. CY347]|uniref:hypothetical protein n=1 Tax=Dyadobacter sp. CY347 TaxID=2909336 RepID=UPI001F2EF05F|nr:hypothetical protein [Dyadobacter sp. CY347]MCF2487462.1 hypothetical protein [Dyadobacter sp. CY347]
MNIYEHVICFEKADGTDKSYYAAKASHDALQAQKGDVWRWLAPKSIAQGTDVRNLALVLVKPTYVPNCGDAPEINAVRHKIGIVRTQESEKYVDLSIWVGSLQSADNWKQFALQRANGQIVIGTFKGQQTNKVDYMQALKEFYESFPYTKVLCDVEGSKMRVRIWEKQGVFRLADEGLTVGLGSTSMSNTNNPVIDRIDQGVFNYPAQDSYLVKIGASILEGNQFTLDNITYVAVAGDTPDKVLKQLISGSRYKVSEDHPVEAYAEAGSRTISNTNKLTVQAVFDDVLSGNDNYHIRVNGTPQPGNVVQVSATGKTTKSYTVQVGDSTDDIEDFFNTDVGGFYTVAAGVIPQVSFLAGIQVIENKNSPSINLSGYQHINSYAVRRWRIIVGSDVRAGNIFYYGDKQYTADDNDTSLDIAAHFGFDSVSFTVETETGATPNAYAIKGFLYNENNVADVTISEGPKLARSSQLVFEAEFKCDIQSGTYQLGIIDERSENPELIALGNHIQVKDKAVGEIIEVADYGDAFGFEYYENGLTQRLRLPVYINPPKQQTEEERVVKFMGGYRRTTTKMEYVSKLVTTAGHLPMHVTLASFLKHEHLRIGNKVYYNAGEYTENMLISGEDLRQATCEITELGKEKNNFSRYRSNYYQSGSYGGFCKVIGEGVKGRLQLWLRSSEIVREIEDWQLLNTASYQLFAETFDNVNLTIYHAGSHYLTAFLPKGQRIRLSDFLKFETGDEWIIQVGLTSACSNIAAITYACERAVDLTIAYDCQSVEKPAFGEFSDDFNYDYPI